MNKTLVAYFSATGTTARAATALASAIGADLYEIRPAAAYTRADLDWHRKDSRSSLEMRDPSCRPALADQDAGIADYERIFLGFPIWWYTAPRIIQSFLESYDFSKKIIIPFATSGGSGMGSVAQDLASSCSKATIKSGRLLNGQLSEDLLRQWFCEQ